jgi:hypothetical protein
MALRFASWFFALRDLEESEKASLPGTARDGPRSCRYDKPRRKCRHHRPRAPAGRTNARGDQPGWRYIEFFTANINNDHTQRAYARALQPVFRPVAKIAGYRSPPFGRSMWRRW